MTGLHYLNARYYNPDDAVFLSQDSYRGDKTDSTTWNLYAYCAGNPVKYVDPSGHYVETIYDAYSLGDSLIELIKEPSLENAWWAAFDVASLIAPIPAGGKVARAADDAVDAVRAGNKVVDGVKGAKKVKVKPKVSKKVKRVKKASKTPKIKSKKGSVKKSAKTKGKSALKNNDLKNIYNSIKEAPNYPKGFKARGSGGTTKNTVKNKELLSKLREIESGVWTKVYKDGYDKYGNKKSIHYFQSKSGKVFDVKVKSGWSN